MEDRHTEATTQMLATGEMSRISEIATCVSSVSASEVVAWVLVSISTVLLQGYSVLYCCGCLRDRPEIQVLTTVLQSMKWRATLVVKPLQSNRPLTHTSMKQSEGEGTTKDGQ